MNSSTYRFTLDLHSTQSQISIPVTQGDTARELYISLADGGVPYLIADGCLAIISIKRPTGTRFEAFCVIESNTTIKYAFEWEPCTADVEGIHDCSITLYNAEGKKICSPRFTMVVSARVLNGDDITITDEDQTAIDIMLAKEAERQQAEEGRKETLRKIQEAFSNGEFNPSYSSVTLLASAWAGSDDPYSQVVSIPGVTERSKVDLLPSVEQLAIFHDKDIAFVTENEDGVVTVYAIGDKPTQDYTIEVCITEVKV